jgi:hypothetical protein
MTKICVLKFDLNKNNPIFALLFSSAKILSNEKNISAFPEKKKKQTWVQRTHEHC